MTSFSLLVQVAKIADDNATASGRSEESSTDAPVSPSEQGTAKSEVCLLHQAVTAHGRGYCTLEGVTAHWKVALHIGRCYCTLEGGTAHWKVALHIAVNHCTLEGVTAHGRCYCTLEGVTAHWKVSLHIGRVTARGNATHAYSSQVHMTATLLVVLHVTFRWWTDICMHVICHQCWSYCI